VKGIIGKNSHGGLNWDEAVVVDNLKMERLYTAWDLWLMIG